MANKKILNVRYEIGVDYAKLKIFFQLLGHGFCLVQTGVSPTINEILAK